MEHPDLETAFTAIYQDCKSLIERRAARILGSQAAAQDICHQVFVRVLDELRRGVVIMDSKAFCYRLASNLALNELRDARRRRELLSQDTTSTGDVAHAADESFMVRELIARCPQADAEVASYFYLDGLDQTEIATLLNTSRRSVSRRLERFNDDARRLLASPTNIALRMKNV